MIDGFTVLCVGFSSFPVGAVYMFFFRSLCKGDLVPRALAFLPFFVFFRVSRLGRFVGSLEWMLVECLSGASLRVLEWGCPLAVFGWAEGVKCQANVAKSCIQSRVLSSSRLHPPDLK